MKKFIFCALAIALCSSAFAKNPVKVVSGDPSVIKGKTICVEFDNSSLVILDEDTKKEMSLEEFCRMKGDDWVKDMGKDDIDALSEINEVLTDKAKDFKVTIYKEQADYILVIKPTKFSYGNPYAVMGALMPKDVNGFFIGEFLIKTPSGETVAEMTCDKINANGLKYTWTRQKCYIYDFVIKAFLNVVD